MKKRTNILVNFPKDESCVVKIGVNSQKQIWKEHIERLINAEN